MLSILFTLTPLRPLDKLGDRRPGGKKKRAAGCRGRAFNLFVARRLFPAGLVSLIEHINSAGAVDDFHLAGVERVRCVGNLKLYERVLNTVNGDVLLAGSAGAGDENLLV